MTRRGSLRIAVLAALLVVGASGAAHAYPQFTLSHEQTCAACHESPSGGGLLNEMGRFTASDLAWQEDGNADFMYGKVPLPDWLSIGGDLRTAYGGIFVPDYPEPAWLVAFPMQADLYLRAGGKGFTANATVGLRGSPTYEGSALSFLASREHYLMWKQKEGASGGYVRAGRFMPIFGLRQAEHPFYTRRFGQTSLFSETYGVAGGWLDGGYEVHVTAFVHDPFVDPVEKGDGAALYAEKRFATRAALGAEARYAVDSDESRLTAGVTGKLWLDGPEVLLMGEVQGTRQSIDTDQDNATDPSNRNQLAAQLLATWFFAHSWNLDVGLGHYNEDLAVKGLDREAVDVNLHWFPWSHWELAMTWRMQTIDVSDASTLSGFALMQVHYRL